MAAQEEYDYVFKVVVVGDSGVGKTNLLLRYAMNEFHVNSKATIGVELGEKTLAIDDSIVKLMIWDTAGQERYRSCTSTYYRGAFCALVVYDITNRKSFDHVNSWISELRNQTTADIPLMLVGNKLDMSGMRAITTEEGQGLARHLGIQFIETSALSNVNVDLAFRNIATDQCRAVKRKELANPLSKSNSNSSISSTSRIQISPPKKQPSSSTSCC